MASHVRSLLRPGGLFVFVVPTYDGPLGPIVHLLDRDPTHIHRTNRKFWLDWAARHFDVQEWTRHLSNAAAVRSLHSLACQAVALSGPAVLVAVRTQMEGANPK